MTIAALVRLARRQIHPYYRLVLGSETQVFHLAPSGRPKGNALVSYVIDAFRLAPGQPIPSSHTNYWESWRMARTWAEQGYAVDVISYLNRWRFWPRKRYDVIVDSRVNLERVGALQGPGCIKVMHVDSAHVLFANAAEARRLLDAQRRRGVSLAPRRFERPNRAIDVADCATVLGNRFTMETYAYAGKPMYRVPISQPVLYDWPEDKDFEACRTRYLWFGSGGLVHKGLDLVLEAFAGMPDLHLTVAGPVEQEEDFAAAYRKELFETPNIRTVGWVDIDSRRFVDLARECVALVYPSCSEGGGGAVVTCLHAGLVPIVTYEASVDVDDTFGVVLEGTSVAEIRQAVRRLSALPAPTLRDMARRGFEFARANHTRERFAEEYRKAVAAILDRFGAKGARGAERRAS